MAAPGAKSNSGLGIPVPNTTKRTLRLHVVAKPESQPCRELTITRSDSKAHPIDKSMTSPQMSTLKSEDAGANTENIGDAGAKTASQTPHCTPDSSFHSARQKFAGRTSIMPSASSPVTPQTLRSSSLSSCGRLPTKCTIRLKFGPREEFISNCACYVRCGEVSER